MTNLASLPTPDPGEITLVLAKASGGDDDAKRLAWEYFQHDTRRLAEQLVAKESQANDLQPTMIISEIWLRLFSTIDARKITEDGERQWSHRGYFWGAIVRTAERFLVDEHRKRSARKRGGDWKRIPMEIAAGELETLDAVDSLAIPELLAAMKRFRQQHPVEAEVAEHRYFLSMTIAQTAASLGRSPRWVDQKWHFARTWLRRELDIRSEA
ncbi:MAG: hypothetical protein CMJ23_06375 [Phycisphaerae bacterium]|nr:hypothetical protein [Phycisphaerae bacterium]